MGTRRALLLILVATACTCTNSTAALAASKPTALPAHGASAVRGHLSDAARDRIPPWTPVAHAFSRDVPDTPIEPTADGAPRCMEPAVTVLALPGQPIDTTGGGQVHVSCVHSAGPDGAVLLEGQGLDRVVSVTLATADNRAVAGVPFDTDPEGTRLLVIGGKVGCDAAPLTFVPWVTYLSLDGGYLALIGADVGELRCPSAPV